MDFSGLSSPPPSSQQSPNMPTSSTVIGTLRLSMSSWRGVVIWRGAGRGGRVAGCDSAPRKLPLGLPKEIHLVIPQIDIHPISMLGFI